MLTVKFLLLAVFVLVLVEVTLLTEVAICWTCGAGAGGGLCGEDLFHWQPQ